jgi:hypothetical protein
VVHKKVYNRQIKETEFYKTFFNTVTYWAPDLNTIIRDAHQIGCQYGLAAMNALHLAAALLIGADEFITTEKPTKPMFRVSGINIISILD